mgnify:FL=1
MVIASRPLSTSLKEIIRHELLDLNNNLFKVNIHVEKTEQISYKIKAFKMYKTEVKKFLNLDQLK